MAEIFLHDEKELKNEENRNYPLYVSNAVEWWGNLLKKSNPNLPQDSISIFEKVLGESLIKFYEDNEDINEIRLLVDYRPCIPLIKAAQYAGISEREFPVKTTMWISKKQVKVQDGYCENIETIWEA